MTTAYYSTVLNHPLETVWTLIRDFNNYPAYIDGVSESVIEDDKGGDEKLITVPVDTTFPYYSEITGHMDLPQIVTQQIEHFFTHYKDLEPNKWVKVKGWEGPEAAKREIANGIASYKKPGRPKA